MIFWIILTFIAYSLSGTMICDKIGALYGSDDFLETIVDGILITFWPLTLMFHFLLDD